MGNGEEKTSSVTFKIEITPAALEMLLGVKDVRVREKIIEVIDGLATDPVLKGKLLHGDLMGYYSRRAVGQRYRVIYQVIDDTITVLVVAAGIRKEGDRADIYRLAQKLVNLGLTETPDDQKRDD